MHNPRPLAFATHGEKQTISIGRALGKLLKPGDVIALFGELGSGKTRLTQGIAQGLNVPACERVCSPSFALVHEYRGDLVVYHMDFYRLQEGISEPDLGLEDYLWGDGVCVIEWAERIEHLFPPDYLEVRMRILEHDKRELILLAHGQRSAEILGQLGRLPGSITPTAFADGETTAGGDRNWD